MDYLALQASFLKDAEPIVDSYKDRLNLVGEIIKDSKNPRLSFNDFDRATLAILYDNVEKELNKYRRMKNLSDRTFSEQVGPFKKHAYNIITALYTTLEIRDLVSFQPLTQKRGAIYKMLYQFASNKGQIRAGDTMFAPATQGKRARYYSSQVVDKEPITWTFDGTNSLATLEYFPLSKPEKVNFVVTGGAAAGTYTYLNTQNGVYNLQKDAGGSAVGTIDPNTGVATLSGVNATDATGTVGTYNWQSEKFSQNSQIPKVTVSITEAEVSAERRNLLIDTMLDVSYDFENQFAKSLNSELEATVIQYLQNELAFRVLGEMYDGQTGNGATTYHFASVPTGDISVVEHAQLLYKMLAEMSSKVRNNIGRGWGNKIICGDNLINFLKILPNDIWKRAEKPKGDGPYFAGTLNGDYDVYYNPDYPAESFIMTYKGESWWEAPYYIGSYLPLMNSQYLLYPDMHGEQGYIAMEAYSFEYPSMVVKGTIANT